MKSSSSSSQQPRRSSFVFATTTAAALLMAGAPNQAHARNLRRSSSSSSNIAANLIVEDEVGFEVTSSNNDAGVEAVGSPFFHDVVTNNRDEEFDRSWHHRQLEAHDHEPKEYINDETLEFVDPEEHEHEREEKSCDPDSEKLWVFKFKTDHYGYETSWILEGQDEDNNWVALTSGPATDKKYEDNTVYMGAACLPGDKMYKFVIMDEYGDGFCCNHGDGYYSYTVDGIVEYDSRTSGEDPFKDKREHSFYVGLPVPEENEVVADGGPFSVSGRGPAGDTSLCQGGKSEIRVKFWADKYSADDNAWEIRNLENNKVILQRELGYYDFFTDDLNTDDVAICVNDGEYEFTLSDSVGDGICCGRQGDGRYEVYMNGELMIYGSDFNYGKRRTHKIVAGYANRYDNEMSQRAAQYLDCHNWRRKKYHEEWFDSTYVPLKYDFSLEEHAQNWANKLLDDCEVNGIKHEPGVEQGENLAKNMGSGKWGQLYPVENICRRWFEREETWPYPANAHFTQGLWRSAKYVGCAESEKTMDNGGTCRVQVCRYARAGNCNMGKYNAKEGDNWKVPMLMDHNPCGPVCPPNGCH